MQVIDTPSAGSPSAPARAAPSTGQRGSRQKGGHRKLRDYLRGLSPMDRLSWMGGTECEALLSDGSLTKAAVEAEISRVGDVQRRVAKIVPSPARLDDWRRGEAFPPPGKLMRRARRVLNPVEEPVAWPSTYLTDGATYDVVIFEDERRRQRMDLGAGPTSASAAGVRALQDRGGEVVYQVKLEAEDEATLAAQVARYTALAGAPGAKRPFLPPPP